MVGCCLVLPVEMGLGRKFLAASASCIVDAPAQEGCRGPMGCVLIGRLDETIKIVRQRPIGQKIVDLTLGERETDSREIVITEFISTRYTNLWRESEEKQFQELSEKYASQKRSSEPVSQRPGHLENPLATAARAGQAARVEEPSCVQENLAVVATEDTGWRVTRKTTSAVGERDLECSYGSLNEKCVGLGYDVLVPLPERLQASSMT
ncbi:hypothetical protein WN51_10860 [Melipona quadrifasciata]|uniref:Uncharacterized protein n=1 Tax=Melipona quadrifasciata TaxID=166423 RepID=A0A0N0BI55_9HYME|nr:hypothetical protein WN51_10860 [Melipona quadrifasciata]